MSAPVPTDPESDPSTAADVPAHTPHATAHNEHLDPITGEPHAHPVGVGVGAMGAGALGAAIGAFAGPIGVVVGAAIGAIAGGLAGKEVAEEPEISPTETESGVPLDEFDHAPAATTEEELPLSSSLSERTEPGDDAFFTGGTVRDYEPATSETRLDEFEHAPTAAVPVTASSSTSSSSNIFADDEPLPTASSGLITPDESSFFADSTTGESSVMTERPFPAAYAVNAKGTGESADTSASYVEHAPDSVSDSTAFTGHSNAEHTVRTAAYYRYLDRENKGEAGTDFEDWIKAEQEVLIQ